MKRLEKLSLTITNKYAIAVWRGGFTQFCGALSSGSSPYTNPADERDRASFVAQKSLEAQHAASRGDSRMS